MNEGNQKSVNEGLANLAIDPDVLAKELDAELLGDPLDEIEVAETDSVQSNTLKECDLGLEWLKSGHEKRLQGLKVFCEHRDTRALPLLIPLLDEPCPVVRMSAVYALGRNPCSDAVDILLDLLKFDSNAYVRKAAAWSLGNYSDAPVLEPLLNALKQDVAAVRLWASSSLAEVGSASRENSVMAANELLVSLTTDSEPVVRSNCIWSLGRLYKNLPEDIKRQLEDSFISVLLQEAESSVRYEARGALEQLESSQAQERLKSLIEEGKLV